MLCGVADRLGAREPDEVLEELLFGFLGTQLLYVVATLGIADLIDGAPRAVEDLAARTDVDPDVLYRYLRALASFGVFAEVDGRAFAQTPTSLLLRQDSGSGWNEFAVVYGSVYRAFAEALPVARDGGNMFERAAGVGWWEWLASRPDVSAAFNRAMQAGAEARIGVLSGFAWREVETVVDVGGGNGTLMIRLLEQNPHLRGVIFDLPEVASAASAQVGQASLNDRCSVEAGSFFERVPEGGDAYLLVRVLHDWDDVAAAKILQRVRNSAQPHTRLLILDSVVSSSTDPRKKLLDLVMLTLVNGKERTASDWERLLASSGWIATSIEDGLIEAQPTQH